MVVKLHGSPLSASTQAVALTLKETGVPYEVVIVDVIKGEHKTPDYLENLHPFGQVPVLVDDDGFKVFESRAISRYIIAKYAPQSSLIPKDLQKNILFEQAFSVEATDFYPFATGLIQEKVLKPLKGEQSIEGVIAEVTKKLEEKLQAYERILGKQKYLAGDELTLADLFHIPTGYLITEKAGLNGLKATPNVARWWADISSRPAWKEIREGVDKYVATLRK